MYGKIGISRLTGFLTSWAHLVFVPWLVSTITLFYLVIVLVVGKVTIACSGHLEVARRIRFFISYCSFSRIAHFRVGGKNFYRCFKNSTSTSTHCIYVVSRNFAKSTKYVLNRKTNINGVECFRFHIFILLFYLYIFPIFYRTQVWQCFVFFSIFWKQSQLSVLVSFLIFVIVYILCQIDLGLGVHAIITNSKCQSVTIF